jgi:hypothetical protein
VALSPASTIDRETGIPDLVRRLTDDSKRLAADELRLAKLEVRESIHAGVRGVTWLGLALGVCAVAMVALTIFLVSVGGLVLGGNYWAGALVVGAVELGGGWMLLRRGLALMKTSDLTMPESRATLAETGRWARHQAPHSP